MNTIQKISDVNDEIMIKNFREHQYNMLSDFCDLFVEYLSIQNNNYIYISRKEIFEKLDYFGLYGSQLLEVNIYTKLVDSPDEEKLFLKLLMPQLLPEQMFFLGGSFYSPAIYAIDLPIVVKKESIKLSSLFNHITIYFKDDIVIFTGVNIPISYFMSLFIGDDKETIDILSDIVKRFKYKFELISTENIISYFQTKFSFRGNTKEELLVFLYNIFFDRYTYNLYDTCYKLTDITQIIKMAIRLYANNEIFNFVDLNYKRLIFMEMLIQPILKRISALARLAWNGYKYDQIKIDSMAIVKHFHKTKDLTKKQKGMSGNFLYNCVNLYTGIIQNRISMVPPGVENAPKTVQTIHPSHFRKICPISISSQKPGRIVSMVPTTKLDVFGRFI